MPRPRLKRPSPLPGAFASYAPLPGEFILFLRESIARRQVLSPEQIRYPATSFSDLRHQIYHQLKKQAAMGKLTTTWLAQELSTMMPREVSVRRHTLLHWKETGVLLYDEEGHPDLHRSAALLLARAASPLLREWRPKEMPREVPWFFCWIEPEPGSPPLMCVYPFPDEDESGQETAKKTVSVSLREGELKRSRLLQLVSPEWEGDPRELPTPVQVPHSALVYTPWEGVAREPGWTEVSGVGGVRFLGEVTREDLAQWNHDVEPSGLREEDAPDIFATEKRLVLLHLAWPRLLRERDAVCWERWDDSLEG